MEYILLKHILLEHILLIHTKMKILNGIYFIDTYIDENSKWNWDGRLAVNLFFRLRF